MKDIPALLIRNMQILGKSQPRLASMLRQYADGLQFLREPVFQETNAGRWVSGITEKPFFEKSVFLQKRDKTASSAVYLVFGTGCAPYLFHVLRSLPREALSVIVVEPSLDLLLYTLSQTSVFQALPPGCRISFIVNDDRNLIDESIRSSLTPIGIFPVSKAFSISHEGEREIFEFQGIEKTLREEIVYILTLLGNSPEDTLLGVRHGMLNLPRILKSPRLSQLAEKYSGMPFICVASGPSLEKNVDLLSEMGDKCVIVACDTVLFNLLERGITPHIVTTIERPYGTYGAWVPRVLEKYREKCSKMVLVSQSVSYPLIAGRWPGPNIIVGKIDVPPDRWLVGSLLGEQLMSSGLSVSHMSLAISVICRASAIALVGQDLAYADDGHSHASNTVHDAALRFEQQQKATGFEVKGALGGTVLTNKLWHTFLQIMERMISLTRPLIYDCTEGGAFIRGTKVEPLSAFLKEHVQHLPEQNMIFQEQSRSGELDFPLMDSRFGEAFSQLDRAEKELDQIRKEIARTVAPALNPRKRQELASSVSTMLDGINASHPVLSFIGQSYTHLSGAALAESRFLETVDQVKKWEKTYSEIQFSHSVTLRFLRQWLSFAGSLLKLVRSGELPDWKENPSSGEKEFRELFALYSAHGSEMNLVEIREYLLITDLLSCKDPLRENWSADALWKAALFLFAQGRSDEARRFMEKAYELLEGEEVENKTIGAFFKDWGRIAGSHDLCTVPSTGDALLFLTNAGRYLPEDDELDEIKRKVILERKQYFLDVSEILNDDPERLALLLKIADAEKALVEKNLPAALLLAEQIAWESIATFPDTSISYFDWLLKTASGCLAAADREIADTSRIILDRVISRLPELPRRNIKFPVDFLRYMSEKGVKIDFEVSDIKEEKE